MGEETRTAFQLNAAIFGQLVNSARCRRLPAVAGMEPQMRSLANVAVGLVAILHLYFLVLEMFL